MSLFSILLSPKYSMSPTKELWRLLNINSISIWSRADTLSLVLSSYLSPKTSFKVSDLNLTTNLFKLGRFSKHISSFSSVFEKRCNSSMDSQWLWKNLCWDDVHDTRSNSSLFAFNFESSFVNFEKCLFFRDPSSRPSTIFSFYSYKTWVSEENCLK